MPFAQITRIREVSSEDKQHLAENLIKPQSGKKWKTKNVGEKSAYVILEMDGDQQITGIDIGNEHSAFVEVLVGKSTSAPGDFTEILITCSFMTPIESRNSDNTNRVRCFNEKALVPTAAERKWSLIKVMCTQPFNKHVQFGLSFLKIHVTQSTTLKTCQIIDKLPPQNIFPGSLLSTNSAKEKPSTSQFGVLKMRIDSTDSESEGASSLFSRWKKSKENDCEQTAAASIRAAANIFGQKMTPHAIVQKTKTSRINYDIQIPDRNREALLFGDEKEEVDSKKEARLTKGIEADKERRRLEQQRKSEHKEMRKSVDSKKAFDCQTNLTKNFNNDNPGRTLSDSTSAGINVVEKVKKRRSSPTEKPPKRLKASEIIYKPLNELLSGVVLVISGIQNPDRGNIRDKALALGAKYKGDWDNTCTHLICAFKNTPKYNQVRGKGKIVTRTWIEKCYHLKKYLPWRRYALDSQELTREESDEELCAESLRPTSDSDLEDRNGTLSLYDLGEQLPAVNNKKLETSSESDTDDEIHRIEIKNTPAGTTTVQKKTENNMHGSEKNDREVPEKPLSVDVYEATTDEEDYLQDKKKQRG